MTTTVTTQEALERWRNSGGFACSDKTEDGVIEDLVILAQLADDLESRSRIGLTVRDQCLLLRSACQSAYDLIGHSSPDDNVASVAKDLKTALVASVTCTPETVQFRFDSKRVYRFDAESWCVVYCRPDSGVVQMTSNLATEDIAKQYANTVREQGGHVFRVTRAGVLIAALELIHVSGK